VFRLEPGQRERLARVHQRAAEGALAPTAIEVPQEPEFEMGGGGLYGTAGDYARFLRMVLRDGELDGVRVLRASTVEALCSNRIGALRVHPLRTVSPRMSNDVDFHPGVEKAWTYAFEINLATTDTGLPAGGLQWAGFPNTYYWLDNTNGIAGVFLTQIVPFADRVALPLFLQFQRAVYSRLN
jgi:CubicO group peptidase (beta-lactamase class C family)